MAKITAEITNDWQDAFPELEVFSKSQLLKVIGPFIAGIQLNNLGGSSSYRPYLIIYPLWEHTLEKCMDTPAVYHEFRNEKNNQYYISIEKHKNFYSQTVAEVRSNLLFPFERNIAFNELAAAVDAYLADPCVAATSGLSKIIAYRFLYVCSLYINDEKRGTRILKELEDCCKLMASARFLHFFGDYHKWFEQLQKLKDSRSTMTETLTANYANKKVSKLPFSDLIA